MLKHRLQQYFVLSGNCMALVADGGAVLASAEAVDRSSAGV